MQLTTHKLIDDAINEALTGLRRDADISHGYRNLPVRGAASVRGSSNRGLAITDDCNASGQGLSDMSDTAGRL